MKLPPLPSVGDLIRLYGLSAQHQLSQNFLLNLKLTDKIVNVGGDLSHTTFLEVGPGPGSLTRSLLRSGAKQVVVIEKDRRFLQPLEVLEQAAKGKLKVVHGDILKVDEGKILQELYNPEPNTVKLIGNLPFNIATPLLLKWLRNIPDSKGPFIYGKVPMILMFQKEVAERIVAPIGSDYYTRLSVMVQRLCQARIAFDVDGQSFVPPPKVTASVVYIEPLPSAVEPIVPTDAFEYVCKMLFQQRRKQLGNTVKLLGPGFSNILEMANIDPQRRPQSLSVKEWSILTKCYLERAEQLGVLDSKFKQDKYIELD